MSLEQGIVAWQMHDQNQQQPTKSCEICREAIDSAEVPLARLLCHDKHSVCNKCLKTYVTFQINEARRENHAHHISCPFAPHFCAERFSDADVRTIVGSEGENMLQKYLYPSMGLNHEARMDEVNAIKCPNCNECFSVVGFALEPGKFHTSWFSRSWITSTSIQCQRCLNFSVCLFCLEPIRRTIFNGKYSHFKSAHRCAASFPPSPLKSYLLDAKNNTKPCPGCLTLINRYLGCSHMRCSRCNVSFCFVCLQRLGKHNASLCPGEETTSARFASLCVGVAKVGLIGFLLIPYLVVRSYRRIAYEKKELQQANLTITRGEEKKELLLHGVVVRNVPKRKIEQFKTTSYSPKPNSPSCIDYFRFSRGTIRLQLHDEVDCTCDRNPVVNNDDVTIEVPYRNEQTFDQIFNNTAYYENARALREKTKEIYV